MDQQTKNNQAFHSLETFCDHLHSRSVQKTLSEEHEADKRNVEYYIRTYNTLLRSSGEIHLKTLVETHCHIDSSLHPNAQSLYPDMSALIYSILRLPPAIIHCKQVLLGQSEETFLKQGFPVNTWERVTASARRRKWFYNGKETLAVSVASVSDTDDIVPVLIAFQIEWNKIHFLLHADPTTLPLLAETMDGTTPIAASVRKTFCQCLHITPDDWQRLEVIWGDSLWQRLRYIGQQKKSFSLRMLGGSHVGYGRATRKWWTPVENQLARLGLQNRPVYLVSSNTHSLFNLLSGWLLKRENQLVGDVLEGPDPYLRAECLKLQQGAVPGSWQNFLYFAALRRLLIQTDKELRREQEHGIWSIGARHDLDIDVQIFDLAKLCPQDIDPRCHLPQMQHLSKSNAIIINIDYPLGMAAYHIMREIMENISQVRGIYIQGKAATLNCRIGDVMISNVVYDEHSQNTYWFDNAFTAQDVQPHLIYGSVLDNQKAVSVKGTFLQNRQYLDFYYQANYTVVEMENGPYLNAIYEDQYLTRYPVGENIHLVRLPYELGILHYASDTPYTRGKNLGAGSLSYFGMDSTYASTVAIVRRIFEHEIQAVARQHFDDPLISRDADMLIQSI